MGCSASSASKADDAEPGLPTHGESHKQALDSGPLQTTPLSVEVETEEIQPAPEKSPTLSTPEPSPTPSPKLSPKLSPTPSPKLSPKLSSSKLASPKSSPKLSPSPAKPNVPSLSESLSPRGLAKQLSGRLSRSDSKDLPSPTQEKEGTAPHEGITLSLVAADTVETELSAPRRSSRDEQMAAEVSERSRTKTASSGMSLAQQAVQKALLDPWEEEMEFTPAQNEAMAEFRSRMLAEGLLQPDMDNKPTIYRFCCARQYEVDKAELMFRNHMAWRKEWKLDDTEATEFGRVSRHITEFKFPEKNAVKAAYHYVHHKTDRSGRLMYIDKSGSINMAGLKAACGHDYLNRLLEAFVWDCEVTMQFRMPGCSVACGRYVGKTLTILDLQGFAISNFDKDMREYLKTVSKMAQDNYPEFLGKMVIINTPWIFKAVWNFVSPMLDKRTRDKIQMFGNQKEYLPKLLELVDAADLPDFLGGDDHTCDFVTENGPWADIVRKVTANV